ncbi:hypothetical protein AWZ03_010930 [Drosophila navojoa]|uniref:trypsin n=1 Tax=Drosophila navojoa TaxID=7232 RepID=A0A484B1Q4_DRONA|nr:hypothetical protein AWZ03_010930 [Drosophila navojoa]
MQFHLMLPTKDSLSNKVELLNAAPDLHCIYRFSFYCCFSFSSSSSFSLRYTASTSVTVESDQFETFEDVSIEDVPFLASVRKIRQDSVAIGSGHICAATIIKNRVLLTAAICIYGKQREDLVVVVGSTFIKGISPMMKVLRVADWRYHGLYKIGEVAYNIGLVFTYDDLSPTMGSIPYLALNTRTVSPHRKCELCGWGGQIGVMQNSPTHFLFTRTTDKMYCYTAAEAAGVMCSYVFFAMYHFDAALDLGYQQQQQQQQQQQE